MQVVAEVDEAPEQTLIEDRNPKHISLLILLGSSESSSRSRTISLKSLFSTS
jgi:hypothetical protein